MISAYQVDIWTDGVLAQGQILVLPRDEERPLQLGNAENGVDVQLLEMGAQRDEDSYLTSALKSNRLSRGTPIAEWPSGFGFIRTCEPTERGGLLFTLHDHFLVTSKTKNVNLCVVIQTRESGTDEVESHTARISFKRRSELFDEVYTGYYKLETPFRMYNSAVYLTDHYIHLLLKYDKPEPVRLTISEFKGQPIESLWRTDKPSQTNNMFVAWLTVSKELLEGYELQSGKAAKVTIVVADGGALPPANATDAPPEGNGNAASSDDLLLPNTSQPAEPSMATSNPFGWITDSLPTYNPYGPSW